MPTFRSVFSTITLAAIAAIGASACVPWGAAATTTAAAAPPARASEPTAPRTYTLDKLGVVIDFPGDVVVHDVDRGGHPLRDGVVQFSTSVPKVGTAQLERVPRFQTAQEARDHIERIMTPRHVVVTSLPDEGWEITWRYGELYLGTVMRRLGGDWIEMTARCEAAYARDVVLASFRSARVVAEGAPPTTTAQATSDAPPAADDAKLAREAAAAAAHVERMMTETASSMAKANGNCRRAAANLRALEKSSRQARAEIDAAKTRSDQDPAFARHWREELEKLDDRLAGQVQRMRAHIRPCKDDAPVREVLARLVPRL